MKTNIDITIARRSSCFWLKNKCVTNRNVALYPTIGWKINDNPHTAAKRKLYLFDSLANINKYTKSGTKRHIINKEKSEIAFHWCANENVINVAKNALNGRIWNERKMRYMKSLRTINTATVRISIDWVMEAPVNQPTKIVR